jgi:hypothetical protein
MADSWLTASVQRLTRRRRYRHRAFVAGVAVLGALCGCSPATSPGPTPLTPDPVGSTSPVVVASASTPVPPSAAPVRHTTSATPVPTVGDPTPAAPVDCSVNAMRLDVAGARRVVASVNETGTANLFALDFTVTNAGPTACEISGWPGVRFRGDGCAVIVIGTPCPTDVDVATTVVRGHQQPGAVLLPPQGSSTFSLEWYEMLCQAKPAAVEITLPGHPDPIRLGPVDLCSDAGLDDGSDAGPVTVDPIGFRP